MIEFIVGFVFGIIITIIVVVALAYESFKSDDDFRNR